MTPRADGERPRGRPLVREARRVGPLQLRRRSPVKPKGPSWPQRAVFALESDVPGPAREKGKSRSPFPDNRLRPPHDRRTADLRSRLWTRGTLDKTIVPAPSRGYSAGSPPGTFKDSFSGDLLWFGKVFGTETGRGQDAGR